MADQNPSKPKEFDPLANIANISRDVSIQDNNGFFARNIRKAIENIDDPEFKDKYSKFVPFFQKVSNYLHTKKQYYKIREHLEYSDLTHDIVGRKINLYLTFNAFFLFSLIGVFRIFKRTSIRLTGLFSLMIVKSQVMDFYASEQQLRSIALDDNDVAAQELRNLYRFYLPDDPDIPEMEEKCEEFKKFMEVRKVIKTAQKMKELRDTRR